jgi:biopolymer transport protein ExbB
MTALGLAVAVPAVLAYNWLQRRNKAIVEELARFSNDLHGYMMSGGPFVRSWPDVRRAPRGGARAGPSRTGAAIPGGTTATGSAIGAPHGGPKKV